MKNNNKKTALANFKQQQIWFIIHEKVRILRMGGNDTKINLTLLLALYDEIKKNISRFSIIFKLPLFSTFHSILFLLRCCSYAMHTRQTCSSILIWSKEEKKMCSYFVVWTCRPIRCKKFICFFIIMPLNMNFKNMDFAQILWIMTTVQILN